MNSNQLLNSEYSAFNATYIKLLGDVNLFDELEVSLHNFIRFVQDIPIEKFDYSYQPGKWTIKDIIQHLIDSERTFAYRALKIARNDQAIIAGFDEDQYAANTSTVNRSIQSLLTELSAVRQSNIMLFKSFTEDQLLKIGQVSDYSISVRALGFLIIGHQKHHQNSFRERYLL